VHLLLLLALPGLAALPACADTSGVRARPTPAAADGSIDVELARGAALPPIACDGSWRALDAQGREVARGAALDGGQAVEVLRSRVVIGGTDCGPPPVELLPARGASVSVGGKAYRGSLRLEVERVGGAPRLLNHVSIEDYLLGVVPGEMPERFGLEALKAQAVAARSYALAEYGRLGRVFADTRSQVYGGRGMEASLASRAVRETEGEVLMSGTRIVKAFYSSTCGGRTAPAGSVFDDAAPGVMERAVTCPDCRSSPNYSWLRRFTAERVCAAANLPAAPLESVTTTPETLPERVQTVTVRAGGEEVTLPAALFRERLSAGRPKSEQLLSTQFSAPPSIEDGALVLEGRGWGHGVGLCQYGASGFAARGAAYDAILARYYPGAALVRRESTGTP
jgi:stage II sporulation protein D